MYAFTFFFLVFRCVVALPIPDRGKFSKNLLDGFVDPRNFSSQAFDIVHNPAAEGYVISAYIRSKTGIAPKGVDDSPEIAKLPNVKLKNQKIGLVMLVSEQDASVKWAKRVFWLPNQAKVCVSPLSSGQTVACASTKSSMNASIYLSCVRISKTGNLIFSKQYPTKGVHTAIQTSPSESMLYALFDTPGDRQSGGKIGYNTVNLENGTLNKTIIVTPEESARGRVIVGEVSSGITSMTKSQQTKFFFLTRETTSDKDGRNFQIVDQVCSNNSPRECFRLRARGTGAAIPVFQIVGKFGYFVQLVGEGASELINVTRIDVHKMKADLSAWGNASAKFEIPPAEGVGPRARSNLASVQPLLPVGGGSRVRILFTTSGTVDENAALLKPLGRLATVDILPNGLVGAASLNTHIENSTRAVAMVPFLRTGRIDSVVLGTITKTQRDADGALYLGVLGDPVPAPPRATPKPRSQRACIGHSTKMKGELIHTVLRRLNQVRLQRHPLRLNRMRRIEMLCFEPSTDDKVCATELHVMLHNNVPKYMRDICATRGDCKLSLEYPLNYKARCGTTIRVNKEFSITMHSSTRTTITPGQAIESECNLQRNSYGVWLLRTL